MNHSISLSKVVALVVKDVPAGAPITAVPEVLAVRYQGAEQWTPFLTECIPGEEPHATIVRVAKQTLALHVQPEALLGVGQGDDEHIEIAMRFSTSDAEPLNTKDTDTIAECGWFSVMHMPAMQPRFRLMVGDAIAQLRHPEGFRGRMGFAKRDRRR